MPFLTKLKSFAKNNWVFFTVIVLPIARVLWRVIAKPSTPSTHKRGEVIDVEVTKEKKDE